MKFLKTVTLFATLTQILIAQIISDEDKSNLDNTVFEIIPWFMNILNIVITDNASIKVVFNSPHS